MHPKVVEGLTYEGVLPASSAKDDTDGGSECAFIDANGQFAPFHPLVTPVVLTWSNVMVSTKPSMSLFGKTPTQPKALLNDIRGSITGGLWGIMGASGSGKTTFISTLALRLDTRAMVMKGDIRINAKSYNKHLLKSMSGYVMQDDLVQATLTVYGKSLFAMHFSIHYIFLHVSPILLLHLWVCVCRDTNVHIRPPHVRYGQQK